jgi:hypothetical protein
MDNPEKTEEAITNGQSRRGNHEWTIKKGQSRMDNQEGAITNGQSRRGNHEWTIRQSRIDNPETLATKTTKQNTTQHRKLKKMSNTYWTNRG